MSPDKYQKAWKADTNQMNVTIDFDSLSKEVQRSHQDFRSKLFWRDLREAGISLVLIPVWFVLGIQLSLPWTWYLTVPALIWVTGFLLVDRRRHPQRRSEPGHPLFYYAKESLSQTEHQIWLLRNVFWWYLLPFSVSLMAFFLDVAWQSSDGWWEFAISAGVAGLFLLVLYGAIYRLNQGAVRGQLEPRRKSLLQLIASLEDDAKHEESNEIADLVSACATAVSNVGLSSRWADNWDHLIPSWREAAVVVAPPMIGAYCGWRHPLPDMGPTLFQSVVGAVIPFEIALGCVWLWSLKKTKRSATKQEPKAPSSDGQWDDLPSPTKLRLPGAPAVLIIALTVILGILAMYTVFKCVAAFA